MENGQKYKIFKNLQNLMFYGFEFEFISLYNFYENKNKKINSILEKLKNILHNKIVFSDDNISVHDKNFYKLTYDRSINYKNCFFIPLELITPVMEFDQAISVIKKIFLFFEEEEFITNNSTGFHINISFKDKDLNKKIDPLKLILLSNDQYKFNIWKRKEKTKKEIYFSTLVDPNIYVVEKILNDKLKNNGMYDYEFILKNYPNSVLKILNNFKIMNKIVWLEKSQSINLEKLFSHNYVEFRIVGGDNYHLKFNSISKEIKDFSSLLFKSTLSHNDKICVRKIHRILRKIFHEDESFEDDKNIKKLFEKYSHIFIKNNKLKYLTKKLILSLKQNNIDEAKIILEKLFSDKISFDKTLTKTTLNFFIKLFENQKIREKIDLNQYLCLTRD